MTQPVERSRDIAHVGAVELFTQVPDQTVDFFVRLMGMSEVGRKGDSTYVHSWDDYESFTVKVTGSEAAGIGRTWVRAAGPNALRHRVDVIEAAGLGKGWIDGEHGIGSTYLFVDPDGHEYGIYYDTEWYAPPNGGRSPALKNQAEPFPGRGANVRRIDHVNYLAHDIPEVATFMTD